MKRNLIFLAITVILGMLSVAVFWDRSASSLEVSPSIPSDERLSLATFVQQLPQTTKPVLDSVESPARQVDLDLVSEKLVQANKNERATPGQTIVEKIETIKALAEQTVTAGIDAAEIAHLMLDILGESLPNPQSVQGSYRPGSIEWQLEGLPEGVEGKFLLLDQIREDSRPLEIGLSFPFSPQSWAGGYPRQRADIAVRMVFGKDWQPQWGTVTVNLMCHWPTARANGLDDKSKAFVQGALYRFGPGSDVVASQFGNEQFRSDRKNLKIEGDLSVLLGSHRIPEETLAAWYAVFRKMGIKVKPEELK